MISHQVLAFFVWFVLHTCYAGQGIINIWYCIVLYCTVLLVGMAFLQTVCNQLDNPKELGYQLEGILKGIRQHSFHLKVP